MLIVTDLDQIPKCEQPIALSIGNFDGVHRGHQALLAHLKKRAQGGTSALLTFSNSPGAVLGRSPTRALTSTQEKLKLIEAQGIDLVILLEFTLKLAQETYDIFLKKIHDRLPFSCLVLGKDAAFGKEKKGSEQEVKSLEKTLHFTAEYLPKILWENEPISSKRIRQALEQGDTKNAQSMLGHL